MRRRYVDPRRGGDQPHRLAVHFQPAIVGELQRGAGRAVGQRRQQRAVLGAEVRPRGGEERLHPLRRERRQDEPAAAAAQGRRNAAGDVRHQQQQAARRRLLDDLQHRVGGVAVHLVGGVDDGDAPAAFGRGEREEAPHPPRVVDDDLRADGAGLAARVGGALDGEQVGVAGGRRPAKDRMRRVEVKRALPFPAARRRAAAARQHVAREAIGQRRLADAARPADQPGVGQPPGGEGARERVLRRFVPGEARIRARRRRFANAGHGKARATASATRSTTASTPPDASIDTQRSGSRRAMSRKAARTASWNSASRAS